MAGLHGERSGLFFNVIGLIKSLPAEGRPYKIVVENVKHLVHSEKGAAFTTVLFELWEAGYDCEWQVVNSKDFGTSQYRERVYIIGHLRGRCTGKILPVGGTNSASLKKLSGETQGKRLYDSSGLSVTLTASRNGTGLYAVSLNRKDGINRQLDTAHTLTASDWKGLNRNQNQTAIMSGKPVCAAFIDMNPDAKLTPFSRCVKAKQNAGVVNHKGETSGVFICQGRSDCVKAVSNPGKARVAQNGRRIKEMGEPGYTITCGDRHGILLCCCEQYKSGESQKSAKSPYACYRIRRLTPRECWRLQSFEDELFDRAKAAGVSDTQLYKQAGNAVTVNIVYEIGKKLWEVCHAKC